MVSVKLKRSKVTSNESIRAELISTPLECNNFGMVLEREAVLLSATKV